jgi:cell fate (sporulation/competence/biofilm development) regulator YlbF (YheA/YmcA/DUF963 family)
MSANARYELLNAKFQHITWRTSLYNYVKDKEAGSEEAVGLENSKLHNWIDKHGPAVKDYPAFEEIQAAFQELTQKMSEVTEAKNAGQTHEAQQQVKSANEVSTRLIGHIDKLLEQLPK